MADAFIISGARTPIGSFRGAFKTLTATDLGGVAVAGAIQRSGLSNEQIDEVIMGNVLQAGVGQAPARQAALKAGMPPTIAAVTVNKVCGSGLKAVMMAGQAVRCGDASAIVADEQILIVSGVMPVGVAIGVEIFFANKICAT